MARDKKQEVGKEDDFSFFDESPKESEVKPSSQKSKVQATVYAILKNQLLAKDKDGNLYRVALNDGNTSVKINDTIFIS